MISASARRLSVFKSVVDSGGFNLAAMKLGIAQPSVGAHIKALEGQVGQPLFLRHRGSRPKLTKAGEALYAYAVDMLDKSAATTQALAEIRSAAAHEITIAVQRDLASQFVSTRLSVFAAKYPTLRVITRIGTIDEVVEHLRTRKAVLGLYHTFGPTAGLHSEVLGHEPFELVVSPQHPLATAKNLTAKTLAAFPFVTGLRGSRFNQLVDTALKKIGLTAYNTSMELEESAATKEMVRHGVCIACLPRCSVAAELAAHSLAALKLATSLPKMELRCGHTGALNANARLLLNELRHGKERPDVGTTARRG
jgi:LysR family transcriptional regulator, low CO2-responsive transcriptional regulator